MRTIVRRGAYSGYVRDHVVQAQYYKDPNNIEGRLWIAMWVSTLIGSLRWKLYEEIRAGVWRGKENISVLYIS